MAVRLPRRGSVDHLADASALPRVHLNLGRDAVLGIACGRRDQAAIIFQRGGVMWPMCRELRGGRSASPRWCSFTDSRWDWTGAVGLKMCPTPQTDPTEGNRSARSEPAVERMPDQACLSTLSAGPLLVCDTRPIHSLDRATQTATCRSAHDHNFQGLGDLDRLFAEKSEAEQSRAQQRGRCLCIEINHEQG